MNFRKLFSKSLVILAVLGFASCSDDDSSPTVAPLINTPNVTGYSKLTSVERSGVFVNKCAWNFVYKGENLSSAVSTLQHSSNLETEGKKTNFSLTYGENYVGVKTDGSQISLTLNEDVLVDKAMSGNTTYNYSYTGGYLTSWNVVYKNDGFAGSSTKGAMAEIGRSLTGNITSIKYTPSADAAEDYYLYSFEYDDQLNYNGLLPECLSTELGCDGFECLYYAGLFGNGTRNVMKSMEVTHSKREDYHVKYDFNYNTDGYGNIVLCSYGAIENPIVVTYKYY
ncbi:MAG: DUF4595 domain-containing protein [Bacteroidaceae bacterium]|nr:DUF4595 domain-containing protein [Bacteroidaceae bacterium]